MGGEPNAICNPVGKYLNKCESGVYCTHAYVINHTFYDKILSIDPYKNDTIDIIYLNYLNSDKKYYITNELLTLQDDNSISDLWGDYIIRTEIYKEGFKKFVK